MFPRLSTASRCWFIFILLGPSLILSNLITLRASTNGLSLVRRGGDAAKEQKTVKSKKDDKAAGRIAAGSIIASGSTSKLPDPSTWPEFKPTGDASQPPAPIGPVVLEPNLPVHELDKAFYESQISKLKKINEEYLQLLKRRPAPQDGKKFNCIQRLIAEKKSAAESFRQLMTKQLKDAEDVRAAKKREVEVRQQIDPLWQKDPTVRTKSEKSDLNRLMAEDKSLKAEIATLGRPEILEERAEGLRKKVTAIEGLELGEGSTWSSL